MEKKALMHSSIIAAIIIAAVISVSMVTGSPGIHPFASADPLSDTNPGGQTSIAGTIAADAGQYINIDPVAEKTTGDLLIVTGSTNLPTGTTLMVSTGSPGIGYGGNILVQEGTAGINRFSAAVDAALLKPGMQTITVNNMIGDLAKGDYRAGTVSGTATFTLKGTYLGSETPAYPTVTKDDYILISAIGDRKAGEQFLITGTTSLPVGTSLIWQVVPESGTPATSIDMTAEKGIMANNGVTKGEGTSNRVSLAVDMDGFPAGNYIVMVSEMNGDISAGNITTGNLTGSALFTLV
jgi:hypothetical protein